VAGEIRDVRAAFDAVAAPVADALSGEYIRVDIDLHPIAPLPDGYPPREPLEHLARELVGPLSIRAVHRLKPVESWPHALRACLQVLDQNEPRSTDPRHLHAESRAIAQAIEMQLGTVRMAARIEYGPGVHFGPGEGFLLITHTHLARLELSGQD
jgi:hypothetical protein